MKKSRDKEMNLSTDPLKIKSELDKSLDAIKYDEDLKTEYRNPTSNEEPNPQRPNPTKSENNIYEDISSPNTSYLDILRKVTKFLIDSSSKLIDHTQRLVNMIKENNSEESYKNNLQEVESLIQTTKENVSVAQYVLIKKEEFGVERGN
jgi:hypothetical protein